MSEAIYTISPKLRFNGAPGAIPTRDLPLRRRTLYAAELREHELVNRKSEIVNCIGGLSVFGLVFGLWSLSLGSCVARNSNQAKQSKIKAQRPKTVFTIDT